MKYHVEKVGRQKISHNRILTHLNAIDWRQFQDRPEMFFFIQHN